MNDVFYKLQSMWDTLKPIWGTWSSTVIALFSLWERTGIRAIDTVRQALLSTYFISR